jgi:translation initiation factor 2 gamma subunit (eIF-2gamma)
MIGHVNNAATRTYHAVSGKHLPGYQAEFNYQFNRRYDLAVMLPRLGYVAEEHHRCQGVYSSSQRRSESLSQIW